MATEAQLKTALQNSLDNDTWNYVEIGSKTIVQPDTNIKICLIPNRRLIIHYHNSLEQIQITSNQLSIRVENLLDDLLNDEHSDILKTLENKEVGHWEYTPDMFSLSETFAIFVAMSSPPFY